MDALAKMVLVSVYFLGLVIWLQFLVLLVKG